MSEMRRNEGRRQRARRQHRPAMRAYIPAAPPRQAEHHAELIAGDPDLRNYLRAPYDPLYNAQASRFFARGILLAAASHSWARLGVLAIAALALAGAIGNAILVFDALLNRSAEWGATVLQGTVLSACFGLLGIMLIWRLLHPPPS